MFRDGILSQLAMSERWIMHGRLTITGRKQDFVDIAVMHGRYQ